MLFNQVITVFSVKSYNFDKNDKGKNENFKRFGYRW